MTRQGEQATMLGKLGRLVMLAAIVATAAACSGKVGTNSGEDDKNPYGNSAVPGATYLTAGQRQTVGTVEGKTLQGTTLNLASYRGKTVVIDYWSSSCVPCHPMAQALEQESKDLASKGVQFVGIDLRDNRDAALAFEAKYHITYPSLFDPTDAYLLDFPGAVPSTTPFTIVIDPQGQVEAKVADSLDYTHLVSFLNRAMSVKT